MEVKNMKINRDNTFYRHKATLLGLPAISHAIRLRYFRERLPRDIPFESSLFILIPLTFICRTCLYILLHPHITELPNKDVIKLPTTRHETHKPLTEIEKTPGS